MKTLKVGDPVYLNPKNSAAKYSKEMIVSTIIKIGAKYIEIEYRNTKFDKKSLQEILNYAENYELFLSEQDLKDCVEKRQLSSKFMRIFGFINNDLTIDQLRKINDIINENI